MTLRLADECVYTIAIPERIAEASANRTLLSEGPRWVKVRGAFDQARKDGREVAVLFADARDCRRLITWATLTDLRVTDDGTAYWIGPTYQVRGKTPQQLKKLSDGTPIQSGYIRPYVPCQTPAFLHRAAESPRPWAATKHLQKQAHEGEVSLRAHIRRERDSQLVRDKKKTWPLVCEACGFDFAHAYGEHGSGFIEVHHCRPISDYADDGEITTLDDLALVCANCHRVLHRAVPAMSVEKLRSLLRDRRRAKRSAPRARGVE